VGDEKEGQPQLLSEIMQQIYYLRLYRDIKSRYRLITYQEVRASSQCPSDTYALALSTAEHMGVTLGHIWF